MPRRNRAWTLATLAVASSSPEVSPMAEMVGDIRKTAACEGLTGPGGLVTPAACLPCRIAGSTNQLPAERLPEREEPLAARA